MAGSLTRTGRELMARILFIDDEPDIRRLVEYALQARGHEVLLATDGQEGVEQARAQSPDLILSDMVMPEMGGMEVLSALKADPEMKDIPVLIVTASAQREEAERAVQAGAAGYLIKPFHIPQLHEQVDALLAK